MNRCIFRLKWPFSRISLNLSFIQEQIISFLVEHCLVFPPKKQVSLNDTIIKKEITNLVNPIIYPGS